jgi:small GTP-binding protein
MFVENGMENKENNNNRFTNIGNILQDYIDEENDESNKNNSKTSSEIKKNKPNKKITKYKIILLGESGVGKTSIINKYIFNKFESSTIIQDENNSDKYIKMIDIDDTKSVELSIYDTTNEKKMGKITRNYYKDAHGAIIVFDFENKESFNKVKYWQKEINNNAPKDIMICILANKSDLIVGRNVNFEEAKALAGDNLCYEVSAKDGNNVSLAFEQLTYRIIKEQKRRKKENDMVLRGQYDRKSINLEDIKVNEKSKKCC